MFVRANPDRFHAASLLLFFVSFRLIPGRFTRRKIPLRSKGSTPSQWMWTELLLYSEVQRGLLTGKRYTLRHTPPPIFPPPPLFEIEGTCEGCSHALTEKSANNFWETICRTSVYIIKVPFAWLSLQPNMHAYSETNPFDFTCARRIPVQTTRSYPQLDALRHNPIQLSSSWKPIAVPMGYVLHSEME